MEPVVACGSVSGVGRLMMATEGKAIGFGWFHMAHARCEGLWIEDFFVLKDGVVVVFKARKASPGSNAKEGLTRCRQRLCDELVFDKYSSKLRGYSHDGSMKNKRPL